MFTTINLKRKAIYVVITILVFTLLAGCSTKSNGNLQDDSDPQKALKVIYVGTMGTYPPFSYQDGNGKITGYDIEVVREIDKRLDDLEFKFVPTPWDSMFLGLESNKYQLVANQISSNPDRLEKYYFTENSYFNSVSSIVVKKGRTGINSLDDLKGLKVGTAVGDSFTRILEEYNKQNNDAIILKYYDGTNPSVILQDVEAGRVDAYLNDPIMVNENINKLGLDVEIVGEPVAVEPVYFVFNKNEQGAELKAEIDKVLDNMKEDGTLKQLSVQWFERDYINFEDTAK